MCLTVCLCTEFFCFCFFFYSCCLGFFDLFLCTVFQWISVQSFVCTIFHRNKSFMFTPQTCLRAIVTVCHFIFKWWGAVWSTSSGRQLHENLFTIKTPLEAVVDLVLLNQGSCEAALVLHPATVHLHLHRQRKLSFSVYHFSPCWYNDSHRPLHFIVLMKYQ